MSETFRLGEDRQGSLALRFADQPGAMRVFVGPVTATDDELVNSETIALDVPSTRWAEGKGTLALSTVSIAPYYWHWWLRWCREFVIRGRVVCADRSPVPAAEVCAYDVDWWFFWKSTQLVACDTTDINGAFEIRFRWCCGLSPWWWWKYRVWEIDPVLVDRVVPVLERDPRLQLSRASARPSLSVFDDILRRENVLGPRSLAAIDGNALESVRATLVDKLPASPELAAMHVWPWWPWWPWRECTPDIIFRVTQDCNQPGTVLLQETVAETRWNIDNPLDVTLVANEAACCRYLECPEPPCSEGECLNVAQICSAPINLVGGNAGAPGPDGYLLPGAVAPGSAGYNGDRPFAGTVTVSKANIMTGVDFYEIEVLDGATWEPLPPGAELTITRPWLQPPHLPAQPDWASGSVSFAFTVMSGHNVVESREHYEAVTGLPLDAFWTADANSSCE